VDATPATSQIDPVVISSGENSPAPGTSHATAIRPQHQQVPHPSQIQQHQPGVTMTTSARVVTPSRAGYKPASQSAAQFSFISSSPPRQKPNPNDPYGHLPPEIRKQLEADLKAVEEIFAAKFMDANMIGDPEARQHRLDSLQNQYATRQSQTRGKYGVKLRSRRSRAAIEEERARIGANEAWHGRSVSRNSTPDGRALKKARIGDGALMGVPVSLPTKFAGPSNSSSPAAPPTASHAPRAGSGTAPADPWMVSTPSQPLHKRSGPALPDAESGMVSTNAVPAVIDPTRPAQHSQSLASSQAPQSTVSAPTKTYTQGSNVVTVYAAPEPAGQASNSAPSSSTPIKSMLKSTGPLSDSDSKAENSDSDDSDGDDIPAVLPPLSRSNRNTPGRF
jgi:hypothetical protein